jgi:molybdopterin biosynthesis enzyme
MQGGSMWVTPVRGQESHMLTGLAQADCLINFSQNETHLSEGDVVEIIPLEWNL